MPMYGLRLVTQVQVSAVVVHMPKITENATLCVYLFYNCRGKSLF